MAKSLLATSNNPSVTGKGSDEVTATYTYKYATTNGGDGPFTPGSEATAQGTYYLYCIATPTDNTNYEVSTSEPVEVKISKPTVITVETEYIAGYTMVYMFVQGEARPKYNGQKVYKIDNMGYWYTTEGTGDTAIHSLTNTGFPTDGSWHTYAYLIKTEAKGSATTYELKAFNQALAGTVTVTTKGKEDVNASMKVDLSDAVAIVTTYHNLFTPAQRTTYMSTILRADVDRNGKVEIVKPEGSTNAYGDALTLKNAIDPITPASND